MLCFLYGPGEPGRYHAQSIVKYNLRQLLAVMTVVAIAVALFTHVRHEWFYGERTIGRFTLADKSEIRIFVDTSFDAMGGTYWTRQNTAEHNFPKQYLTSSDQSQLSKIQLLLLESDDDKLVAIVEHSNPNVVIAMIELGSSFRYPNGSIDSYTEDMLSKLQDSHLNFEFELNQRIGPWGDRLVK